jgi:hypothetical protein
MALPPTPAKASTMTVFSLGADSAMCAAILLEDVKKEYGMRMRCDVLCDGLWSHAEPGVFGHPDAFVVFLPDLEALEPVSGDISHMQNS